MSRATERGKDASPKSVETLLVFPARPFPTSFSLLLLSFSANPFSRGGHSYGPKPRPPQGVTNAQAPPLPTRDGLPSFPRPPAENSSVRARPRSRLGSASGARSVWPLPPCCCGCEKAAAAEERPDATLQRPRRCPAPALAGSLVGWRRRPCRGGPRHVLPPGKKPTPPRLLRG